MAEQTEKSIKEVFVVLNPVAGHASEEEILKTLEEHFGGRGWIYEVYKTTGEENVADITRAACQEGAELVIAAGGDGTVAGVVNGLMHAGVPLGIVPVGTGNGLARAMSIPLTVEEALDLITGEHQLQTIDALQVGDQYYLLNVSVGISSRSMRDTDVEKKRRFGVAAYAWTVLRKAAGLKPRRFNLEIDGHQVQVEATEILVANGAILQEPFLFGPAESFTDGQVEAHILLANSLGNYLRLGWHLLRDRHQRKPDLKHLTVRDCIRIDAAGRPQPVQADGELIGQTPVEIQVVPDALTVIATKKDPS